MKWIAAAGVAALGLSAQAQAAPMQPAPAEVSCARMGSGDLADGRPIRCAVVLDLTGEAAPSPPNEPQIVHVPAKVPVSRHTLIDAPPPRRSLGVWSGQAVLTAQPATPACAHIAPAGEDVWFAHRRSKARPAKVSTVIEPAAGACTELG